MGPILRGDDPPEIDDKYDERSLRIALCRAVEKLRGLSASKVVLAAAPNCYNSVYYGKWWGLRVDGFFTEYHGYSGGTPDDDLATGPPEARLARAVLEELEAADWQTLFARAFGLRLKYEILALFVEAGVPLLIFSDTFSSSDRHHVFTLEDDNHPLRYYGECYPNAFFAMRRNLPLEIAIEPDDEEAEYDIDPRSIKPVPDPLAVDPKYKLALFLLYGGGLLFLLIALSPYLTR